MGSSKQSCIKYTFVFCQKIENMNDQIFCRSKSGMLTAVTLLLMCTLLLTNCSDTNDSEQVVKTETSAPQVTDSTALVKVIRNMYQWYETSGLQGDFLPAAVSETDNAYKAIDWNIHAQKVVAIKKSTFFSAAFIEEYSKIAFSIDSILRAGNMKWQVGDLSPFSNGADAWCDCQDSPERYWETMNITIIDINQTEATANWTWPGKAPYEIKAVKENNEWKIKWMQGLNYSDYKKNINTEM